MGAILQLKKYIFQHRGSIGKFDKLWAPWLDTPGLTLLHLIMDRLVIGRGEQYIWYDGIFRQWDVFTRFTMYMNFFLIS